MPLLTPPFLTSLRTQPHLPRHTWYFVAGVTLSALNLPQELPALFRYALEHCDGASVQTSGGVVGEEKVRAKGEMEERLYVARRMRDALVKSAAIVGLPKVCSGIFLILASLRRGALEEAVDRHDRAD